MEPKKHPFEMLDRTERISFPELNLFNIEAKIDTGAYSTTIHCHDIEIKTINDIPTLCFKLLDPEHADYSNTEQNFTNYTLKTFKNSFGEQEERFVIKTLVQLGKRKVRSNVSLTSRANMRYPVLVGRKLLKHRFTINVAEQHLLSTK